IRGFHVTGVQTCALPISVGDLVGNERRIRDGIAAARDAGAQLSLFPELAVTGYPPEDLLLKEHFLRDARAVVDRLAGAVGEHVADRKSGVEGKRDARGGG